jgi:protein TonB
MERPSHILFQRHSSLSRAPLIGLAIALQLAGFCLFAYGLKDNVRKFVDHTIEILPIKPQELTRTPPPPPPTAPAHIDDPKPVTPLFDYPREDPGNTIRIIDRPPQPPTPPKPAGIERAVAAISGTHTVPPYPPIARRLGAEGVVTLRLTVGTDGRVTATEIVTSAGREDLDQAARDWILAHWRYRPALKDGNPAAAQVLASVTYSLKNER